MRKVINLGLIATLAMPMMAQGTELVETTQQRPLIHTAALTQVDKSKITKRPRNWKLYGPLIVVGVASVVALCCFVNGIIPWAGAKQGASTKISRSMSLRDDELKHGRDQMVPTDFFKLVSQKSVFYAPLKFLLTSPEPESEPVLRKRKSSKKISKPVGIDDTEETPQACEKIDMIATLMQENKDSAEYGSWNGKDNVLLVGDVSVEDFGDVLTYMWNYTGRRPRYANNRHYQRVTEALGKTIQAIPKREELIKRVKEGLPKENTDKLPSELPQENPKSDSRQAKEEDRNLEQSSPRPQPTLKVTESKQEKMQPVTLSYSLASFEYKSQGNCLGYSGIIPMPSQFLQKIPRNHPLYPPLEALVAYKTNCPPNELRSDRRTFTKVAGVDAGDPENLEVHIQTIKNIAQNEEIKKGKWESGSNVPLVAGISIIELHEVLDLICDYMSCLEKEQATPQQKACLKLKSKFKELVNFLKERERAAESQAKK